MTGKINTQYSACRATSTFSARRARIRRGCPGILPRIFNMVPASFQHPSSIVPASFQHRSKYLTELGNQLRLLHSEVVYSSQHPFHWQELASSRVGGLHSIHLITQQNWVTKAGVWILKSQHTFHWQELAPIRVGGIHSTHPIDKS